VIALSSVSARGVAQRGRMRATLTNVSFEHRSGVLGIIGAPKDGTTLLMEVLSGSVRANSGRISIAGTTPEAARARVARVSFDAPLPEALRVEEVCDLASDVRAEPRRPASERLGILGLGLLARRRVASLSVEERRAVTLAIALTSTKSDVLLIEEPLVLLDAVAPRLVADALRARAASACVLVTSASARDVLLVADRFGVLTSGAFTEAPAESELALLLGGAGAASMRIHVAPAQGRAGAAALAGLLGADNAVTRVETTSTAGVIASGPDPIRLARAVTHALAAAKVEVELVEPNALSLEAIRAALAARSQVIEPPPPPPPSPEEGVS
jgi:ABC-type multidrug transport system ATPase subunit